MRTIWLEDEAHLRAMGGDIAVGDVVANSRTREIKVVKSLDPLTLGEADEMTRRRIENHWRE